MTPVEYCESDASGLERVRPLWTALNDHHHEHSRWFRKQYEQMIFEDRAAHFLAIARTGSLRVDIARDPEAGLDAGYCVSSLTPETIGEIESIFVLEAYREHAIGSTLVTRALAWMRAGGAARIRVSVAQGNEAAEGFYGRFGFLPRMTVLEIPPEETTTPPHPARKT